MYRLVEIFRDHFLLLLLRKNDQPIMTDTLQILLLPLACVEKKKQS